MNPVSLKRIDDEIKDHRQRIAFHQVEIARLEDARNVVMRLAEDDIAAAESRREQRHLINGHAQHTLIVRPTGADGASLAAKAGNRKPQKPRASVQAGFRDRILDLLKDGEPMSGGEICNYLGVPAGDKPRKPVSNALYNMRVKGVLDRDDQMRYHLHGAK